MNVAIHCVHRWISSCEPGMYIANMSSALECDWQDAAHVHAHCVVDDFGTLQPISFVGLTAQNNLIRPVVAQ